jgi:hypothetical protein
MLILDYMFLKILTFVSILFEISFFLSNENKFDQISIIKMAKYCVDFPYCFYDQNIWLFLSFLKIKTHNPKINLKQIRYSLDITSHKVNSLSNILLLFLNFSKHSLVEINSFKRENLTNKRRQRVDL